MADVVRGLVSTRSPASANDDFAKLRDLASGFEMLLEQAEGFARGGDHLGAQARAHYARQEFATGAASAEMADVDIVELRRHLDLRLRHYDRLARGWQEHNATRRTAYLVRERQAIGADVAPTRNSRGRRTRLAIKFRRMWTRTFGSWTAAATRMGSAP
jgi:hypothetical protein